MANLTASRTATARYGQEPMPATWNEKVKAATRCWAGGMAVIDPAGSGYVEPARVATGLICLGRFDQNCDNSAGANGALNVNVLSGCFPWDMGTAGDVITQADRWKVCFIIDDHTVGKTDGGGTRSKAGVVYSVDANGQVWVISGPSVITF